MHPTGYFRSPSLCGQKIVFVCDDHLWRIDLDSPHLHARQITNHRALVKDPYISPNGKKIAFLANEFGDFHVYTTSIDGGPIVRVSSLIDPAILGWKDDETLLITSSQDHFTSRESFGHELNLTNFELQAINLGPMSAYQSSEAGDQLLGRNNGDPARWKRYKGGTAGVIWVRENKQDAHFQRILKNIPAHLANPTWYKKRIYFISDHEGHGNIYSCLKNGTEVKRHTHHEQFYVRHFSIEGERLAYQCGADLYLLDLQTGHSEKINFQFNATGIQASERFENAEDYLDHFDFNEENSHLAVVARGQLFTLPAWGGSVRRHGPHQKNFKWANWIEMNDRDYLLSVAIGPEGKEEISLLDPFTDSCREILKDSDWGKILQVQKSPANDYFCICNGRNEIYLAHLKNKNTILIDKGDGPSSGDICWHPSGEAFCYRSVRNGVGILFIYIIKEKISLPITSASIDDQSPAFSKDGKFLFFVGIREIAPIYSAINFDLSYPIAQKIYVVSLLENDDPFLDSREEIDLELDDDFEDDEGEEKKERPKKGKQKYKFHIDLQNIEQRIESLPLKVGSYQQLAAAENKIFYIKQKITPLDPVRDWDEEEEEGQLFCFDFKKKKEDLFQKECWQFALSPSGKSIAMDTEEGLRIVATSHRPNEGEEENSKDGWINLERIRLKIDPKNEWEQMYKEAWILQREHFWREDMAKINWAKIYKNYLSLLPRVLTRSELSDLLWEMQGELGTSHCYEFKGDYHRKPPKHIQGHLGAVLTYQPKTRSVMIKSIPCGEPYHSTMRSPLLAQGVALKAGDHILEIDGEKINSLKHLADLLQGKAAIEVSLTVKRKNQQKSHIVNIKTLTSPLPLNYRNWVEKNRAYVHKKTNGKIGYVHIPDMGIFGHSEFFKSYLKEHRREGLIIDTRYNGGGNISELIFQLISQRVVGFNISRYFRPESYPRSAVNGPLLCLTNEHAGSDGDIFCHSFKLKQLGKLVGKRTWGGVIGIWTRYQLNDQTLTSQPEFSFWFQDVEFDVENHGTDPDIEVEISPEQWSKSIDSQLDRAILEILKDHQKNPPLRTPKGRGPSLRAPRLPKE